LALRDTAPSKDALCLHGMWKTMECTNMFYVSISTRSTFCAKKGIFTSPHIFHWVQAAPGPTRDRRPCTWSV